MKQFEVELQRSSFLDIIVEAENEDEAIEKAYDELGIYADNRKFWDLSYVEQMK